MMTSKNPPLDPLSQLMGELSSIEASETEVLESIRLVLHRIPEFRSVEIVSQLSLDAESFETEIGFGDKWIRVEAKPTECCTERDWTLFTSVASGVLKRALQSNNRAPSLPEGDSLSSLLIVKDRDGKFLYVNDTIANLYGSIPSQMIGKKDADFLDDQALADRYMRDDRKAIESGEPVYIPYEKNIRQADGKTTGFETVKVPLKNSEGQFDRVLIVATPCSRTKKADVSLTLQNSFLMQIIDESPNWVIVKDQEGRFVYVNQMVCQVFGKTKREILGKTDLDLNPQDSETELIIRDDLEVIQTRERKLILEEKTTGVDGKTHWNQTIKSPVIEPDGSCNKVLIVCNPINEQRAATDRLRENETFLREVIDSNPNLIMVKDHQGKFILANQAVAELYGVSISDLLGKSHADFNKNPDELKRIKEVDLMVLESGKATMFDAEKITDCHGVVQWFQTIKKPIQIRDNGTQLLVVCANVSNQIEARTTLRKAKEEAIKASLAKTEFLARMSHELRTPLNAILGFNQLLRQDESLTDEQIENLDIINKSGKHLLNLISDILEMSKVEMGELDLKVGHVDIHNLLNQAIELFEVKARENGVQLFLEIPSQFPRMIAADEVKLRQVIMNLVSNAVKFTTDGEVKVCLSDTKENLLRLEVKDNGPGIARDEKDRVFGRFHQTKSGVQSKQGSGLGLAISRSLIELMGGEIDFESKKGVGSTFFFEIPLIVIQEEQLLPQCKDIPAKKSGEGYRVLVADDAPPNRKFVTALLSRLGYETFEASNGIEAVAARLSDRPDLILMDVNMPEMDGMTATATIRENETTHHLDRVPIVALTANAFDENVKAAAAAGCDGFVVKPFEFDELIDVISKLLANK